jgi:hypothetical protein
VSGFEIQLRDRVVGVLARLYEDSLGPKRDADKIVKILSVVTYSLQPISTSELKRLIPKINENDLEDYLLFMRKNPPEHPFLLVTKEKSGDGPGGPQNHYKINPSWTVRIITLEARMKLEPSEEPGREV